MHTMATLTESYVMHVNEVYLIPLALNYHMLHSLTNTGSIQQGIASIGTVWNTASVARIDIYMYTCMRTCVQKGVHACIKTFLSSLTEGIL